MAIQGRYVLIQGTLDGKDLTILNSYGPNIDDREFYPKMQYLLAAEISSTLIWLGDYNCVLDGQADRDPPKLDTKPCMTKSLGEAIQNLALCDIWRIQHPGNKDYTCYSTTHGTYTRLDRIYVTETLSQRITKTQHLARYLSDHSPVLAEMKWGPQIKFKTTWRLTPEVLSDPEGRESVVGAVTDYMAENWGSMGQELMNGKH